MAIIKKSELKQISGEQAGSKLKELQKEMVKIRSQIALGSLPENPGRTKELKRTIAKLLMIKKNKLEVSKKV